MSNIKEGWLKEQVEQAVIEVAYKDFDNRLGTQKTIMKFLALAYQNYEQWTPAQWDTWHDLPSAIKTEVKRLAKTP